MARTRTAGIRIDSDGRRIIDKEHRGVGIYLRLGPISQEDAEQQLANEVARIDAELRYKRSGRGPADLETVSLAARNSLKTGAPGRT